VSKQFTAIADSISTNAVSFSSACTIKRFQSSRCASTKIRRLYFLGGAASSRARWGDLLQAVREGTWSFYSKDDKFLRTLCRNPIGVCGFNYHYPKVREIDLSWHDDDPEGKKAITKHGDWGIYVG
jgi:hypothetical protein